MTNKNMYDVIVVGGGPAGLTSAIYLARAQYRVLVLEKENFGGQIRITHEVVNYPGVYNTNGHDLTETMRRQAEAFGAEFLISEAKELDLEGDIEKVHTDRGVLEAYSVILATGANPRKIGFPGEAEFEGRGIAYCATCDGEFFTGKDVLVLGGGFAAAEEAVFLTKFANKVTILVREPDFTCAKAASEPAKNHPNIDIHYNTEVLEVTGENSVTKAKIRNNETGETWEYEGPNGDNIGVFVFAGYIPKTDLVKGKLDLNPQGYVETTEYTRTSQEGVFSAGDLNIKDLRQVATAVSDGAIAATQAEKHALEMQKKTGIKPEIPAHVLEQAKITKAKYVSKGNVQEEVKPTQAKNTQASTGSSLDPEIIDQLQAVFSRFTDNIELRVFKNSNPASQELSAMMKDMAAISEKVSFIEFEENQALDVADDSQRPVVKVYDKDNYSPIAFHGVPGGHEFQSFVLGLYNLASEGQAVSEDLVKEIKDLKETKIDLLVSLSCTQCPDLVVAAQRLATLSDNVTVDVYDINHFGELKEKYQVMSVPCIIFNDGEKVAFGKKNVKELVDLINSL